MLFNNKISKKNSNNENLWISENWLVHESTKHTDTDFFFFTSIIYNHSFIFLIEWNEISFRLCQRSYATNV